MEQDRKIVIGEISGAEYEIQDRIGKGAQGIVYSIKGGKYALKLIGIKDSARAQLLKRKISYITTRDISDLPISKPFEQIKGRGLGYIMEIATDMVPLESLLKPTQLENWWKNTGGLKRRLLILKKLAKVLSDLHARGLVYGDLSPKNVFISSSSKYAELFLIDADNITHESKVGKAVYTPGYGAPELVKGISGLDTFTDDFSFAIIAYQVLTLNHPLIGDYVNEGDPDLEEKADLGEIPWVNHSTDSINVASTGITHTITISKKMMNEFQNTFEIGMERHNKRTTTAKWYEILAGALNFILSCEHCGEQFFISKSLTCMHCSNKTKYVGIVSIYPLLKSLKKQTSFEYSVSLDDVKDLGNELLRKVSSPNDYIVITENDLFLNGSDLELFKTRIVEDYIFIKGINQKKVTVYKNGEVKENVSITNEIKVSQDNWFIFSKELNSDYQRVIKIRKYAQ